ncbi:MAG: hypothetical protein ACR5KX_03325 [Wolbachia sp.]
MSLHHKQSWSKNKIRTVAANIPHAMVIEMSTHHWLDGASYVIFNVKKLMFSLVIIGIKPRTVVATVSNIGLMREIEAFITHHLTSSLYTSIW